MEGREREGTFPAINQPVNTHVLCSQKEGNTDNGKPEVATGELGLAPPASSLEAFGSKLQVVSQGECLWCNFAAVGTEWLLCL